MISTNIIQRVFHIRIGQDTGTAFTIEHGEKQYLITAAHVVSALKQPYEVELFHENAWKKLKLELTGICLPADIAVFSPIFQLSPAHTLPATSDRILFGQDVFFLGFPYGMFTESGALNNDFPFPFVKKACLSAFFSDNPGVKGFFLDGHNNPGFSGGPIVCSPYGQQLISPYGQFSLSVMAVISGYRFSEEPAYHGGNLIPITVRANTGIVVCYDIKHAIEEIEKNPNGAEIKKA